MCACGMPVPPVSCSVGLSLGPYTGEPRPPKLREVVVVEWRTSDGFVAGSSHSFQPWTHSCLLWYALRGSVTLLAIESGRDPSGLSYLMFCSCRWLRGTRLQ